MPILEIKNVKKVYGKGSNEVVALNDISLTVEKGEFIALVGTSGSGKSTLMHLIGGVDTPSSGSITVDGVEVHTQSERALAAYRRQKVAMILSVFQPSADAERAGQYHATYRTGRKKGRRNTA